MRGHTTQTAEEGMGAGKAGKGHQGSNPVDGSSKIELYLSKGCFCAGDSYAQTARDQSLLYTISDPPCCRCGQDRVLRDANSAPLLHSKHKGLGFKRRVDVYKGDSDEGGNLDFIVKPSSIFSNNLHIFLASSSLDGPPDYKLKPSKFGNSLKIFRQEDVVAKAKQDFLFCGCFMPDYRITIFSGMDQAMVVLLVAIYDDLRPKSSGGGG